MGHETSHAGRCSQISILLFRKFWEDCRSFTYPALAPKLVREVWAVIHQQSLCSLLDSGDGVLVCVRGFHFLDRKERAPAKIIGPGAMFRCRWNGNLLSVSRLRRTLANFRACPMSRDLDIIPFSSKVRVGVTRLPLSTHPDCWF